MKKTMMFVLLMILSLAQLAQAAVTVSFAWDTPPPISGVTFGYHLYRGTAADGSNAVKLNPIAVTAMTIQDTTAALGSSYYYFVTAVNTALPALESLKSNIIQVDLSKIPGAPPNFRTTVIVAVP